MKLVRRSLLVAAAGVAVLALTACGLKATTGATSSTRAGKATTTRSTPAEPTTADGHTSAGVQLKFGDRAVVPVVHHGEKFGTVAITVTSIEKGTPADLERFQPAQVEGVTPFRIRFTVEFVKGDDLSGLPMTLVGRLAEGERTGVGLAGQSTDCASAVAVKGFNTPGVKYESCSLAGSKDGAVVEVAAWADGLADDAYAANPVLWGK